MITTIKVDNYHTRSYMKKVIIIGAGGYSKSVIDSMSFFEYKMCGFIDDYKEEIEHLGYPIFGKKIDNLKNPNDFFYFIAIGDNNKRTKWYNELKSRGLKMINIIDKSAIVSEHAIIGEGCFIGKMAIINSNVEIGDNCIINTKALVEHGCKINNNINISTNSVLNGDVIIGDSSFIGSCSVINGQINIGKNVIIGSGSVVINNIEDNCTAVGVPAKVIRKDGVRI